MTIQTARQRLALAAERLKKSWIVAYSLVKSAPTGDAAYIPDYDTWSRKELERYLRDLKGDFIAALKPITVDPHKALRASAVRWLADRFDEWQAAPPEEYKLCTLQEFNENVCELKAGHVLDAPPYTEVLTQGPHQISFRHPEYMLARDIAFLYDAYVDGEALLVSIDWSRPQPGWAARASENVQGLGRATIQACFSLLESFTAGLARAHVMTTDLSPEAAAKLLETRPPLRRRLLSVPRTITGRQPPLDLNKPPLDELFGEVKLRRDAIVHCEPGPEASERGYHKESLFHQTRPEYIRKTLNLTESAIRSLFEFVYERPGPAWFPRRDEEGRFGGNLTVVPRSDI